MRAGPIEQQSGWSGRIFGWARDGWQALLVAGRPGVLVPLGLVCLAWAGAESISHNRPAAMLAFGATISLGLVLLTRPRTLEAFFFYIVAIGLVIAGFVYSGSSA